MCEFVNLAFLNPKYLYFLRIFLFPFSVIYGIIIFFRNFIFEYGIIMEKECKIPTISIGNLSTGGTGKTPFTETLLSLFNQTFEVAVLSRGYGRKTTGFRWVEVDSSPADCGDEMLQIKRRYPNVRVAVCEKRLDGAKIIREQCPDINLLLLDDAFQHRYIVRDVDILLTTYKRPYYRDYLLPMGNLREFRYSKTRAHIIILTKCPPGSTRKSLRRELKKIRAAGSQYATFTMNSYEPPKGLFDGEINELDVYKTILLVTGIANNQDLIEHLESLDKVVEVLEYKDHANYNESRVKKIIERYHEVNEHSPTCIITTDKDAVKLQEWKSEFGTLPIFSITYSFELDKNHELKRWILPKIMR